ncbi:MAG: hypothetical protein Q9195_005943 [Heterodermia aff. obscurata]
MSGHISVHPTTGASSEPEPDRISREILDKIGKSSLSRSRSGFEWHDFLLPYGPEQLPEDETEEDDQLRLKYIGPFIEEQDILFDLTPPNSVLDEIHAGRSPIPHIQVPDIGNLIDIGESLGVGRDGTTVYKVLLAVGDERSLPFAMKRIRKPQAPRNSSTNRPFKTKAIVKDFKNECENMRKCGHRHLVSFHASFTDKSHFGIIMSPAAELTLRAILDHCDVVNEIYRPRFKDQKESLRTAFGCLLEAVRYLHDDQQIKHRDLKPGNILLHERRILICDFGSTYHWEPPDRKESTEDSQAGTRRYKAPEILQDPSPELPSRHNRKTDIFSLGCIFLELHTVLCGETLDQMAQCITQDQHNRYNGNGGWTYTSALAGVERWLEQLRCEPAPDFQQAPAVWIKKMVMSKPVFAIPL